MTNFNNKVQQTFMLHRNCIYLLQNKIGLAQKFIVSIMYHKDYSNFVKSSLVQSRVDLNIHQKLNGEEARRLYLEEVKDVKINELSIPESNATPVQKTPKCRRKRKLDEVDTSNLNLFLSAEQNDVTTLTEILDSCPEKINSVDEFGWSLLMIACQANSVDTVKELLKRGIDTSVRDKAGNSATTFVIKNKNFVLADILLNKKKSEAQITRNVDKVRLKEEYTCKHCSNKKFPDKQQHLSSTVHNINASKGKKTLSNYVIPESNRGYQIMLKVGWDKESGLGRDGRGKKYPLKAIQKLDRKGLGLEKSKSKNISNDDSVKNINKKRMRNDYNENRKFEVNFRRQFY